MRVKDPPPEEWGESVTHMLFAEIPKGVAKKALAPAIEVKLGNEGSHRVTIPVACRRAGGGRKETSAQA